MRITGGIARGRVLKTPKDIRPSQDMVRQALFSMLADIVPGSDFLDLYSGSGSVGLDAWSRGAGRVVCVEQSRTVWRVLEENIKMLEASNVSAVCTDALRYIRSSAGLGMAFDIIYADPPYAESDQSQLMFSLLKAIEEAHLLKEDGFFMMEQRVRGQSAIPDKWELVKERKYGATVLKICRKSI